MVSIGERQLSSSEFWFMAAVGLWFCASWILKCSYFLCILPFQPFQRWSLTLRGRAKYLQTITTTSPIGTKGEPPPLSVRPRRKRDSFLLLPNQQPPRRLQPPRRPPYPQQRSTRLRPLNFLPAGRTFWPGSHLFQPRSRRRPHASPTSRRRRHLRSRRWTTPSRRRWPNREAMSTVRTIYVFHFISFLGNSGRGRLQPILGSCRYSFWRVDFEKHLPFTIINVQLRAKISNFQAMKRPREGGWGRVSGCTFLVIKLICVKLGIVSLSSGVCSVSNAW